MFDRDIVEVVDNEQSKYIVKHLKVNLCNCRIYGYKPQKTYIEGTTNCPICGKDREAIIEKQIIYR
jgi:predicted Zn-ribbon and HTH transcriptional regulator